MTVEALGRRKYRVHPQTCTHGSFLITLPKDMNTSEDAQRILSLLLEKNTRASTLPKFKPQWFEGADNVRVRLEYEGQR